MTDDNLQMNKSAENISAGAPAISGQSVSSISDEDLDLDSIYNLDDIQTKMQSTLSSNAPVFADKLDSFRAQSNTLIADTVVDNQVLADLQNKSKLPEAVNSAIFSSTPTESSEIETIDLNLLLNEETSLPIESVKSVKSITKPVSEASKLEAELEANIIDLDAELKKDENLPDLFDDAESNVSKTSILAPTKDNVNNLEKSRLNKVQLTKNIGKEQKRVATVQKLMKTDTIYDRANKKDLKLSAVIDDKKLKSPVEELAELTLEDWARLGDIPSERAEKIKEKIASLGAKSIIDEIKGLKAWRSSQIYQTYLELGIAGIQTEDPLQEIISAQGSLSMDEWITINQLNRELMI